MIVPALPRGSRITLALALAIGVAACGGADVATYDAPEVDYGAPPPTEVETVVEDFFGNEVADDYAWLEEQEAPNTRAWIDAQNAYTDGVFEQLPGRAELTVLATSLLKIETMGTPREKGGKYFYFRKRPDDELSILYYRDGIGGEEHVLLDPHGLSDDHTARYGWSDISDDGELMIYTIREGGVDEVSLHVKDLTTGEDYADEFPANRYGSVQLSKDKTGMYYGIYGTQEPRIYHHVFGTDPADDAEIFGEGYTVQEIPFGQLNDDGTKMLITVIHGSSGPTELYLADMGADGQPGEWVEIINDGESRTTGGWAGDRLLLTTNLDAPKKRIVVADPASPSPESWVEFMPEYEDRVIQGAGGVGGYYFVSYLESVIPKVAQYTTDGELVRELDAGVIGSAFGPSGEWDKKEAFFGFSSFHMPTTTYRFDVETGEREVWHQNDVPIDMDAIDVKQVWYTSKDGTRIPMFIIHRKDMELDGANPTYLTGYGGFNISRTPGFSGSAAAWVDMGGVYAIPNLRGGGEFGEEWHEAGMFENKQNVFDDFIAAAEYLIEEGYTSSERLAIAGGSNGGLLVGAAMTQRPDLFGAVVCTYPLLDMVKYDRFMVAKFWVPEYGSAAGSPEEFEYIEAYSPYHQVVEGTEYPATLFISGDGDTRVAPLHARKMAALVQRAQGGDAPILLRYHTKAGHSGGMPVSEQIEQMVDTFSFLRWQVAGEQ